MLTTGYSGGGVFDNQGRVIGTVSMTHQTPMHLWEALYSVLSDVLGYETDNLDVLVTGQRMVDNKKVTEKFPSKKGLSVIAPLPKELRATPNDESLSGTFTVIGFPHNLPMVLHGTMTHKDISVSVEQ